MSLRSTSPRRLPICCLTLFIGALSPWLVAEEQLIGTHVVREGETLEGIAAFYLGSAGRWRELWELNKDGLSDPNRIYPGDKVRVLVSDELPRQTALLATLARRVEDQRHPRGLEKAGRNDLLKPLDVLQTYEGASAELHFDDRTNLIVTELSRIILGENAKSMAPVDRRQVEIVVGQADLESRAATEPGVEIEIKMGGTVVNPKGAGGRMLARSRRPQDRGALLMVYEGESDVASGGSQVKVRRGMGTTVAEGNAPSTPEKLLDAPAIVQPEPASRSNATPDFEWRSVAGARSYILEICHDPRCAELERRITDLRDTRYRGEPLPVASLFWRVTARSNSGLDGYPSGSSNFEVVNIIDETPDRSPPLASVSFVGPMVGVNDRLVVGVGTEIRAEVEDDGSGLAEWSRLLDGKPAIEDDWRSPWSSGAHTVSVHAVDRSGNSTTLEPVSFVYDPDPPTIHWGVEDEEELGSWSGVMTSELDPLIERDDFGIWATTTGTNLSPLIWTSSKVKWLPMEFGDWKINSDKPYIVVRARQKRKKIEFRAIERSVSKSRGLFIHATDSGCGVESMRYQLFVGPEKQKVLVVEAVDALDNKSRVIWELD